MFTLCVNIFCTMCLIMETSAVFLCYSRFVVVRLPCNLNALTSILPALIFLCPTQNPSSSLPFYLNSQFSFHLSRNLHLLIFSAVCLPKITHRAARNSFQNWCTFRAIIHKFPNEGVQLNNLDLLNSPPHSDEEIETHSFYISTFRRARVVWTPVNMHCVKLWEETTISTKEKSKKTCIYVGNTQNF